MTGRVGGLVKSYCKVDGRRREPRKDAERSLKDRVAVKAWLEDGSTVRCVERPARRWLESRRDGRERLPKRWKVSEVAGRWLRGKKHDYGVDWVTNELGGWAGS